MNVCAVESTTLATVAYDEVRELLRLEFRSQAIYDYSGVPAIVHQALLGAPSKGSYFNQAIRGRFPYERVSACGEKPDAGVPARCGREEQA
jgi:KTSC domain